MQAQKETLGLPPEGSSCCAIAPGFQRSSERGSVSVVVDRLDRAKARATDTAEYIRGALDGPLFHGILPPKVSRRQAEKLHKRLCKCGAWLKVTDFYESGRYVVEADRCNAHLLCPACAILRGNRMMRRLLDALPAIAAHHGPLRWYLLTVTIRNGPDVSERVDHLHASWSRMMQEKRVQPRKGYHGNSLSHLAGGFCSIELKRGRKSGQWHPHLHALVCSVDPLPVEVDHSGAFRWPQLSQDWRKVTGDSFIVECHPLTVGGHGAEPDLITGEGISDGAMGALAEVCKYALKLTEMEPADVVAAWRKLRGRRMVRTWGVFRGVQLEDDDEQPTPDELAQVEAFMRYSYTWNATGYKCTGVQLQRDPGRDDRCSAAVKIDDSDLPF